MSQERAPSVTELVYDVLQTAENPLRFQEIFDQVCQRRPITAKNPKATIRNALSQGRSVASLGDGRYGYLPHVVVGSRVRLPLTERKPAGHPLLYPEEVRDALWPSFFEIKKRRNTDPIQARLPNGEGVSLLLQRLGGQHWGSPMPEALRKYLVAQGAAAQDALIIELSAEAGSCAVWLERRVKRDQAIVRQRNAALADAAERVLRTHHVSFGMMIWDLTKALLGRGLYRAAVAPDPLEAVLGADSRFVAGGMQDWLLAESVTPDMLVEIEQRKRVTARLTSAINPLLDPPLDLPGAPAVAMERMLGDLEALMAEQDFTSDVERCCLLPDHARGASRP